MDIDRRILELALRGLEAERSRIELEMSEIRRKLGFRNSRLGNRKIQNGQASQKPRLSAAGRKAISDAMKRRWASKKRLLSRK